MSLCLYLLATLTGSALIKFYFCLFFIVVGGFMIIEQTRLLVKAALRKEEPMPITSWLFLVALLLGGVALLVINANKLLRLF